MAGSSLAKETARVGYRTMVCPAFEYPLTVTQFTQEQCDNITSPILRSCMSQMGYNRYSAKEVVYGPVEMGGFGFHDLLIEQGIHQVTALVGHLREKKSNTGNMMKIELDWCHLQAGTADHLLKNPSTQINYIETCCWIMSIHDFLRMYNVRLEFTEHSHPVPLCEGGEFIVDALRLRGQCTTRPKDMQRLNACRMHLRVCICRRFSPLICCIKGEGLRDSPLCSQVAASSETIGQGLDILELQALGSLLQRRQVLCLCCPNGATRSLSAV
jgi:hypothetical protein